MSDLNTKEMRELFKATASCHETADGRENFREFAQALNTPILDQVRLQDVMSDIFVEDEIGPGAQAEYPVADDFDVPVWVLPGLGMVAQNLIEGVGETIYVPTFTVDNAAQWKLSYARDGRVDIVERATRNMARAFAEYSEESAWRVVVPAGTTDFAGMGLLSARSAPIYEVDSGSHGAGYLSKELINKMIIGMTRNDRNLTVLLVSPEDEKSVPSLSN